MRIHNRVEHVYFYNRSNVFSWHYPHFWSAHLQVVASQNGATRVQGFKSLPMVALMGPYSATQQCVWASLTACQSVDVFRQTNQPDAHFWQLYSAGTTLENVKRKTISFHLHLMLAPFEDIKEQWDIKEAERASETICARARKKELLDWMKKVKRCTKL